MNLRDIEKAKALRTKFLLESNKASGNEISVLVAVVRLPHGAHEVITNNTGLITKINYYVDNYDEHFRLKANPEVQIVGYVLV